MNLIIDTNIIISAFIKDSKTRELLIETKNTYYSPEYLKEEINKHKDLILEKSGLNQKEFELLFNLIMENIRIIPKEEYDNRTEKAHSLLENIDVKDVPFLACALAKNYPI